MVREVRATLRVPGVCPSDERHSPIVCKYDTQSVIPGPLRTFSAPNTPYLGRQSSCAQCADELQIERERFPLPEQVHRHHPPLWVATTTTYIHERHSPIVRRYGNPRLSTRLLVLSECANRRT